MLFKNVKYCDYCGSEIEQDDINRTYDMGISSTEDRCLGSAGCIDSENEVYALNKDAQETGIEDAIADLHCIFCDECCRDSEDLAIRFEHLVREARAKVFLGLSQEYIRHAPNREDRHGLSEKEWAEYKTYNKKILDKVNQTLAPFSLCLPEVK